MSDEFCSTYDDPRALYTNGSRIWDYLQDVDVAQAFSTGLVGTSLGFSYGLGVGFGRRTVWGVWGCRTRGPVVILTLSTVTAGTTVPGDKITRKMQQREICVKNK